MSQQRYARLRRGQSYTYKNVMYQRGKWRKVSEAVASHLEESAVDPVTVIDGLDRKVAEHRPKFEFGIGTDTLDPDEYLAAAQQEQNAAQAAAPRSRRRSG